MVMRPLRRAQQLLCRPRGEPHAPLCFTWLSVASFAPSGDSRLSFGCKPLDPADGFE